MRPISHGENPGDPRPPDGTWCWVRLREGEGRIFPAVASKDAVGGWSNEDTWEDFHDEVEWWRQIPKPRITE